MRNGILRIGTGTYGMCAIRRTARCDLFASRATETKFSSNSGGALNKLTFVLSLHLRLELKRQYALDDCDPATRNSCTKKTQVRACLTFAWNQTGFKHVLKQTPCVRH